MLTKIPDDLTAAKARDFESYYSLLMRRYALIAEMLEMKDDEAHFNSTRPADDHVNECYDVDERILALLNQEIRHP